MNNNCIIGSGSGSFGIGYATCGASNGSWAINSNNNIKMKEENKKLYRLTFLRTKVVKDVIEVMAESKEQAKELVSKGNGNRKCDATISEETKLAKIIRIGKKLLS